MNKITIHQSVLDVSRKIAPKILKKNININIFYKYFFMNILTPQKALCHPAETQMTLFSN